MKLLLIGNHTCGNRGDAAILRGLIAGLEQTLPRCDITVTSRYPVSSSYLLGRDVRSDFFAGLDFGKERFAILRRRALPYQLLAAVKGWQNSLPRPVMALIDQLRGFDAVVQVGGSFFVDLYGVRQFEAPLAALAADRPLLVLGHSFGPLGGRKYQTFMRTLLSGSRAVGVREPISMVLLERLGMPMQSVSLGADTAWLIDPPDASSPRSRGGRIGITVRRLAPFDRRLGTTQEAYEAAFAELADTLIDAGYSIVAGSTCTGIESYNFDDRMIALRVRKLVRKPERFEVVMDELNDLQLADLFGGCDFVIGTRLHSAIISLTAGTPAIALNYEHKSEGIMTQLGMPDLAQPIARLLDGSLAPLVLKLLARRESFRVEMLTAVARERARAQAMIADAVAGLSTAVA